VEPDAREFIAVARILRTQGNKGEVLAYLHTDFPARFETLQDVWLSQEGLPWRRFILEHSWLHKGRIVLKLQGIDSIGAAECLAGAWVAVPREDAVALPEGTYFDHDLVGCMLEDVTGAVLGKVCEVLRLEGNHQLVVEGSHGSFLVPAREPFLREIRVREKRIRADLPDGLLDLNR